jgi:hypothetical protein
MEVRMAWRPGRTLPGSIAEAAEKIEQIMALEEAQRMRAARQVSDPAAKVRQRSASASGPRTPDDVRAELAAQRFGDLLDPDGALRREVDYALAHPKPPVLRAPDPQPYADAIWDVGNWLGLSPQQIRNVEGALGWTPVGAVGSALDASAKGDLGGTLLGSFGAIPVPAVRAVDRLLPVLGGLGLAGGTISLLRERSKKDQCYQRYLIEHMRCDLRPARYGRGCRDRATTRWTMCNKNRGKPDPNEPDEWSEKDEEESWNPDRGRMK